MRKFCSYGPLDTELHYYVPRETLVNQALTQLVGEKPEKGGHYITVWAPRQTGKTWIMNQVERRIRARYGERFAVVDFSLGSLRGLAPDGEPGVSDFPRELEKLLQMVLPETVGQIESWLDFQGLFSRRDGLWDRPVILIIDEVDTLHPAYLDLMVAQFRDLYLQRERNFLHGLALVGVQAVLGMESERGSPFNVQRSVHIPNLTPDEVEEMFRWYERESGQMVEDEVIERVYYETRGQPGLVSWLGELLTESYNPGLDKPLDGATFRRVYWDAVSVLPNNNVLNIINKARQDGYRDTVLDLFRTTKKVPFNFDDPRLNYLYLHGVIDWEDEGDKRYARFSSPFVQKRLFNYFTREIFPHTGRPYAPFEDLSAIITDESLDLPNLLRRYERYLRENRGWLLRNVPRRKSDMRPYEAVFHFNLYAYLFRFLEHRAARVWPEFPTGNGKIDILIEYAGQRYGLEVKSYLDAYEYRRAVGQAARYGRSLGLGEITLAFFIEAIDDDNRARYEVTHHDEETGVTVRPVFVETGE